MRDKTENKVKRLLLVESNKAERKKFELFAKKTKSNYKYTIVDSIKQAKDHIKGNDFDIVIFGHSLDDENGLELLNKLSGIPMIIVADTGEAETAVKAMKMGAFDYIFRDEDGNYLNELSETIIKGIAQLQAENELKAYKGSIHKIMVDRIKELQIKIAECKQIEEALRERKEKMRSLIRLARQLELAHNYSELVNSLKEEFQKILGWNTAWIYLFEDDYRYARLLSGAGDKQDDLLQRFPRLKIKGDLLLEEIAESDYPTVVKDARTDPRTNKEIVKQLDNRTIVNVPLFFENKKLGIVGTGSFGDEGVQIPSPSEMEYLEAVASHLAVVIDRIGYISERTKNAEKITELAEFNKNIVSSAPVGIITLNPKGKVTSANDAFLKMMGSPSLEETLRLGINIVPSIKAGITENFSKALTSGEPFELKNLSYTSHWGKELIANVKGVPQKTEDGRIDGIILVVDNVTLRVEAEQALRESEERYRAVVENSHDGILIVGEDFKYSYVNDTLCEILGRSREELIGLDFRKVLDEESNQLVTDRYLRRQRGEKIPARYEFNIVRKNGEKRRVEISSTVVNDSKGRVRTIAQILDITKRKQSETALQKSEESLKLAQEFGNIGSWDWDILNNRLTWSDQAFIQMGLKPNELVPTREVFENFICPDDRAMVSKAIEQTLKHDKPYSLELRMIKPDGKEWIMHTKGNVIKDEKGKPIRFVGVQQDITERKQAERELRESEDRYRVLLEHSPNGMVVHSEGRLVYTNKAALVILNAKDESDIIGKPIFSLLHPDSIKQVKHRIKQTFREEEILEPLIEKIICLDGTVKKVEITGVPITYDQKPSILIITKDISELQKAYEEIRKNQERLTALVHALPDLIFVLSKKGVILESYYYKNEGEFYVPPKEFLGKKITEVLPQEVSNGTSYHIKKLIDTGELQTFNYSLQFGEEKKFFEARMTLKGKEEILIASRDVTERKRIEKRLQESHNRLRNLAERLQMIREEERATIAREIHDDLGQSLTALKMDISWMKNSSDLVAENRVAKFDVMLELINSAIQTVKRIATELRPGILDDLGLAAAIEWQAAEFQKRFNIKCKVSINKSGIIIKDEISIAVFRIFQETLTNIARHSGATKADINLIIDDAKLNMEIADNGIGIDKEQTNSPTSFGLFGMKERVNILDGSMEIIGKYGKGTKVNISIPLSKETVENK